MKKSVLILTFSSIVCLGAFAQQFKVVTVVESIIPMGIGRSRIIEAKSPVDYKNYTTDRVDGKSSKQANVSRGSLKIDSFSETKLLNFYSMGGINFQNIASNDAIISSKLNSLAKEGWELFSVVSGVESDGGKQDGVGIYITRFIFKK